MNKKTEIELLDATIKAFGRDSYLGPWLAEVRDTLVRDIGNDVCMTAPLPRQAQAQAERMLTAAREQAATIKKQADDYATREIIKTDKLVTERKQWAKHVLVKAASEIYA